MIRFSAALVVVAIGVLAYGADTSKLTLIYIAIAISALALVTLAIGVALKREELFGQVGAPADTGGSTESPAAGQAVSVDGGAEPRGPEPVLRNGPVAPPVPPFPGLPGNGGQPARGADSGIAADLAADGSGADGGWDRFGQPSFGRPSLGRPAYGQAAYGPAGPAAESFSAENLGRTAYGQPVSGQPAFGQNPVRNPWPTSATTSGWAVAEPDPRPDRDRDGRPPWSPTADQPGYTDTSSYGASRAADPEDRSAGDRSAGDRASFDATGGPPQPGRHSRNAGDPWSPFTPPPASGPDALNPPFPSAPPRIPGGSAGAGWFSQPAEPAGPRPAAEGTTGQPPAEPAPTAGTSFGSGWSSAAWSWSTPSATIADDAVAHDSVADDALANEAVANNAVTDDAVADDAVTDEASADDAAIETPATTPPVDSGTPAVGSGTPAVPPTVDEAGPVPTPELTPGEPATVGEPATAEAITPDEPVASGEPTSADRSTSPVEPVTPDELTTADDEPGTLPEDGGPRESDAGHAPEEARETGGDTDDAEHATRVEPAGRDRLVTVVPGVPRYHEPNCILIRFMPEHDVQSLPVLEAKKLGTPCVACQPED